ncbi:MAG TPA: amidohydrolase [Euryarchaeota archaeon]|nr:MAG: N-ethylammeline chlorohydrolase [Thermoplasmatales archaeon ex4484_6]HHD16021.1 amidohydrolase [Euryarchaeota archaeon]
MKEPIFLKNARLVLTMDGGRILENASVRLEDGQISRAGEIERERGDEVIDCSSSVIIPGMVNSHTHAAMVLLRGLNDDAPLESWLSSMWKVEERLTPDLERMGAEMGFLEMIRTGTTACIDMYGAFEAAEAAERVGIRMANGPPLISNFGSTEERLSQARKFIERYRHDERIIPLVNLHSIYTNDEEAMIKAGELSRKEDIPLHVHCSETRKEVFGNRRERGKLALEELDSNGCVWERSILAHLGWASSWEFNTMRERGASAVHCPNSNQKLGTGGFFPYRDLKRMGIRIGLGTDSAASNNSLDMFREMKAMALLQKGQYWDPTAALAEDALLCATVNGNDILGLRGGRILPGMNADLAIVEVDPMLMPLRSDNLMSALVYSAVGQMVRGTIIGGEIVYLDDRLRNGESLKERYSELATEVDSSLVI